MVKEEKKRKNTIDRQSLRLHVLSEDADDALSARQLQSSAGSTIRNGFQVGIVDAALEVIKRPTEAVYTLPYSVRWWTLHILLRTGGEREVKATQ